MSDSRSEFDRRAFKAGKYPTPWKAWQAAEQSRQAEIAALKFELALMQGKFVAADTCAAEREQTILERDAELAALKQRIADAEKQEPVALTTTDRSTWDGVARFTDYGNSLGLTLGDKLYALPPIPPDVATLQQKLSASEADVKRLCEALQATVDCMCELPTLNGFLGLAIIENAEQALAAVSARKEG